MDFPRVDLIDDFTSEVFLIKGLQKIEQQKQADLHGTVLINLRISVSVTQDEI